MAVRGVGGTGRTLKPFTYPLPQSIRKTCRDNPVTVQSMEAVMLKAIDLAFKVFYGAVFIYIAVTFIALVLAVILK